MARVLYYLLLFLIAVHGLIHLLGFVAYWPLTAIESLPLHTRLLQERWDVGAGGMRIFSVIWLVVAVGFLAVVAGLLLGQGWWRPLLMVTTALSLAITLLDVELAYAGAVVNVALIVLVMLAPRLSGWMPALGQ